MTPPPPQPRRKKWTEAEERSLINKYEEMVTDGTLSKMKTREKKYNPIALHVTSLHHLLDPLSFPWQWTWKDVSTKVQNMRHQYSLVKQKIKKLDSNAGEDEEEFDWIEGVSHWSNFLRYKEVFGDVPILFSSSNESLVGGGGGGVMNDCSNRVGEFEGIARFDGDFVDLEFDYDDHGLEEGEVNYNDIDNNGGVDSSSKSGIRAEGDGGTGFVCGEGVDDQPSSSDSLRKKKKRKMLEKKGFGFLANRLGQLREMEARFEQREVERERERRRREHVRMEMDNECEKKWEEMEMRREESRAQWLREWEAMLRENDERERRRRDEELIKEREWEERLKRRRSEWKNRMDEMLSQHRAEMGQIQARIVHEQQNLTSQFIGMVSQWTGHPAGISDHSGATAHYLSQMMQNLHHVNGMVHGDARVEEGDNQEDQFIVDG